VQLGTIAVVRHVIETGSVRAVQSDDLPHFGEHLPAADRITNLVCGLAKQGVKIIRSNAAQRRYGVGVTSNSTAERSAVLRFCASQRHVTGHATAGLPKLAFHPIIQRFSGSAHAVAKRIYAGCRLRCRAHDSRASLCLRGSDLV